MNHTPECQKRQDEISKQIAAWKAAYPNHCQKCLGSGGETYYQSVPYGMGSTQMPIYEPCDCTTEGKCARCGELGLTSEERGDESTGDGPCKFCQWNYDDCLPTHECVCNYE